MTLPETPRTLVVHKSSRLAIARAADANESGAHLSALIAARHASTAGLEAAHDAHGRSLELVRRELRSRGWPHEIMERSEVTSVDGFDLVMTVGGDGTVLDVSHRIVDSTPLLGINSVPESSAGYFCGATARELSVVLDRILQQGVPVFKLCRMTVKIKGEVAGPPVLNDILICDANPAATCRYQVEVAGHSEKQKSSGMWVCTPAGSTAATRSAGGFVLPLESGLLEYLVREPYPPNGKYSLLRGILHAEDSITLVSMMDKGRIFLDGPHTSFALDYGDTIEISGTAAPFHLLGIHEDRRIT